MPPPLSAVELLNILRIAFAESTSALFGDALGRPRGGVLAVLQSARPNFVGVSSTSAACVAKTTSPISARFSDV